MVFLASNFINEGLYLKVVIMSLLKISKMSSGVPGKEKAEHRNCLPTHSHFVLPFFFLIEH